MTDAAIISDLRNMADAKSVEIWNNFGINTPDEFLGVGLTRLKTYSKKIKKDHDRALRLWESKIHDAKLLATMTEEPKRVTEEQLNKQVKEIYSPDLADKFCSNVVCKTPYLVSKAEAWCNSPHEYEKRCGFMLLVSLAKENQKLDNSFFECYLQVIVREIQQERNWVKEAMNYLLIAIGKRNRILYDKAVKAATMIGKIKIDYGNTSCKHPDALEMLNKAASAISI